jgi:hypothetical protein
VFRYTPQASSEGCAQDSIIIKRTPINNSTFKYLLHEKTMLRYLNGSERIAVERLDGGFASLLVWNMNNGSYQNERFIAYENGGRPLEVQFFKDNSPPPSIPLILHIAQDLLQALIFLFDKRVVHRNLNLGTVVFSEAGGAKLIALGSAKYMNHLPYEECIYVVLRVAPLLHSNRIERAHCAVWNVVWAALKTTLPPPKLNLSISCIQREKGE